MDAGTWIALGSLAGSAIALYFAWRADQRATEARTLARAQDERDRSRFDREEADAEARGRAKLDVSGTPFRPQRIRSARRGGREVRLHHADLRVTNLGPATARRVVIWLVDADGNRVTDRENVRPDVLPPDPGSPRGLALLVEEPAPSVLQVRGDWEDDAGRHEDQPLGPWSHGVVD